MRKKIEELVEILNKASEAYYNKDEEIMSNLEYDRLYDELVALEKSSGITLSTSPTVNVGYEVLSSLPKEPHPSPMLSLDKTKEVAELKSWLGDREGMLSWKLDGLTVVLTYQDGKLAKAVTRGDGTTGEVITANARTFINIPLSIPYKNRVVLRGEAVISYDDFQEINVNGEYKNPRNLCSGSVRQLNSRITAQRKVRFYAFSLGDFPEGDEAPRHQFRHQQQEWMREQGFETVESIGVRGENIEDAVGYYAGKIESFNIPSDGLVLIYDDIEYGKSLGMTAKFPRDSIAFKWRDELKETELRDVLWSASRTGLINPVALFEPVELEGTTVTRASIHNVSILEELELARGDRVRVYKANMIIPQIQDNLSKGEGAGGETRELITPPERCPSCGHGTEIREDNGVKTLHCTNPECPARKIKSFAHFVSRNAMNIEGLSEATVEKLVDEGVVKSFADLFRLEDHRDRIVEMEGFGERSYEKLVASVERARHTTPDRFLYALGIPGIGSANAKVISRHCTNSWKRIQAIQEEELKSIEGIGHVMARGYREFFEDKENKELAEELAEILDIDESFQEAETGLDGKTFVITGSLNHFGNRDSLKAKIEDLGGKVSGSVSKKTSYLINNDKNSSSSKNKKAAELGIPVISEEDFLEMIEEEL